MMIAKLSGFTLCAALALSGCGIDVAGYYTGTWTSQAGQSGTLAMGLRQDGSELFGTLTNTSPACQFAGIFGGKVDGTRISGVATNARADARSTTMRFELEGEAAEDAASMSGSYSISGDSNCAGEKGTWKLVK